jgi:hypothetical protein
MPTYNVIYSCYTTDEVVLRCSLVFIDRSEFLDISPTQTFSNVDANFSVLWLKSWLVFGTFSVSAVATDVGFHVVLQSCSKKKLMDGKCGTSTLYDSHFSTFSRIFANMQQLK